MEPERGQRQRSGSSRQRPTQAAAPDATALLLRTDDRPRVLFRWSPDPDRLEIAGDVTALLPRSRFDGLEDFLSIVDADRRREVGQAIERLAGEAGSESIEFGLAGDYGALELQAFTCSGDPDDELTVLGTLTRTSAELLAPEPYPLLPAQTEHRYRILFESFPVGISLHDRSGQMFAFNRALLDQAGYVDGASPPENDIRFLFADPDELGRLIDELDETGAVLQREIELQRRDGSHYAGLLSLQPVQLEGRTLLLSIAQDVSERKELEDQLYRSQKLEVIGQLAGGIAHDFNNLLTLILGHAHLAKDQTAEPAAVESHLRQILTAANRAARLVHQLLAYARKQVVQPRVLIFNDLVLEMDRMMRRLIGENVELVTIPADDLWPCRIDPVRFEQVLVNLVVNARDAMPEGGTLTIETANAAFAPGETPSRRMPPGEYVRLSVTDTGHGMGSDTLERIFEPFFTTKEQGQGSGLGMSTAYGIVKQSGGFIWVESELERGTRVDVYLPRSREAPQALEARPSTEAPKGTEHLLLVEDEPRILEIAARTLRTCGYRVRTAQTAEHGIEVAEEMRTLDAIVTDLVLPRMGGRELVEVLAEARPTVRALYISGYAGNEALDEVLADPRRQFLSKPFVPSELAVAVRSLLDADG